MDDLDREFIEKDEHFEEVLDGMIESTIEFINDDGLMTDEGRIHDLSNLLCVKELFEQAFKHEVNE